MRRLLPILFIFAVSCCSRGTNDPSSHASTASVVKETNTKGAQVDEEVECPVCGLKFNKKEAAVSYKFESKEYYFLLKDHFEAFKCSPGDYLRNAQGHVNKSKSGGEALPAADVNSKNSHSLFP